MFLNYFFGFVSLSAYLYNYYNRRNIKNENIKNEKQQIIHVVNEKCLCENCRE